jgi:hypothetical protein
MGKVYPSKGGTIRYGVQATMNGSKSLPKYITEQEFNRLGFEADMTKVKIITKDGKEKIVEIPAQIPHPFDNATIHTKNVKDNQLKGYVQDWIRDNHNLDFYDFNIMGAESFEASVDVGEKRISSRKDYDIDNDYEYEDLEIGDVDLLDYEDDLDSNLEDEIKDAIRESVDDHLPLADGESRGGYVDVDTKIDISVPVSGQVKFDWTSNENYYDENTDNEWNAEYLREKEQVAGLDKEERYELYDENKLECDECGAVNKTVGYVEEGYKLCQPCDREMMAAINYVSLAIEK